MSEEKFHLKSLEPLLVRECYHFVVWLSKQL